uniref:Uncharacterized protein n=1 Tax=Hemiselmis andersenii TaxID=464988 RepID=A0A6U4VFJ2_HEMAN|mmetsp:Transcript_27734/g.67606  ORF Transcript_27734/g.67606 Transcript_27734/m.67606 type:complete len:237 (+) Transcript_27734:794-1504(+)
MTYLVENYTILKFLKRTNFRTFPFRIYNSFILVKKCRFLVFLLKIFSFEKFVFSIISKDLVQRENFFNNLKYFINLIVRNLSFFISSGFRIKFNRSFFYSGFTKIFLQLVKTINFFTIFKIFEKKAKKRKNGEFSGENFFKKKIFKNPNSGKLNLQIFKPENQSLKKRKDKLLIQDLYFVKKIIEKDIPKLNQKLESIIIRQIHAIEQVYDDCQKNLTLIPLIKKKLSKKKKNVYV